MNAVLQQLDALRAAGAAQQQPVRWHYVEALARRAQEQPQAVRQHLHARLQQRLTALEQALARAPQPSAPAPAPRSSGPLAELTRYLQQQSSAAPDAGNAPAADHTSNPASPAPHANAQAPATPRGELKSVHNARSTWSRLSAERQLTLALDQAPSNAGPINSHMVVLRSLSLMRDIAPDYLNRFVSYVDTLLWLEHAEAKAAAAVKTGAEKKGRAGRGKARAG